MARKDTTPSYDRLMSLSQIEDQFGFSSAKVRRAIRYGHLVPAPRESNRQPLKVLNSEVTRWVKEGASSRRPEGFTSAPVPAHLAEYWNKARS